LFPQSGWQLGLPAELSQAIMTNVANDICDPFFNKFDIGGHKNVWSFRLFMLLFVAGACAHPLICYFTIAQNPHVVFWIGLAPQYVIYFVPVSLVGLFCGMMIMQMAKLGGRSTRIMIFLVFFIAGSVSLVGGSYLAYASNRANVELTEQCGTSPLTMQMQHVWSRLHAFHQACIEFYQDPEVFVQQCPGFEKTFQDDVYVQYLEDLEFDHGCQGFCHYWSQPFFTEKTDSARHCAAVLGDECERVIYIGAIPIIVLGIALILIGGCTASYEHI
jgi:hypothetical protein